MITSLSSSDLMSSIHERWSYFKVFQDGCHISAILDRIFFKIDRIQDNDLEGFHVQCWVKISTRFKVRAVTNIQTHRQTDSWRLMHYLPRAINIITCMIINIVVVIKTIVFQRICIARGLPWDSEYSEDFGENMEGIGPILRKIELYAYHGLVFSRYLTRFHKSEALRFFPLRFWAFWGIGPILRKIELYAYRDLLFSRDFARFHKSEVLCFFPLKFWAF